MSRPWIFQLPASDPQQGLSELLVALSALAATPHWLQCWRQGSQRYLAVSLEAEPSDRIGIEQALTQWPARLRALMVTGLTPPTTAEAIQQCQQPVDGGLVWTLMYENSGSADTWALWHAFLAELNVAQQQVGHLHRLTRDPEQGARSLVAYECWTTGPLPSSEALKAVTLRLSAAYAIDLVVQQPQSRPSGAGLAVFDMDSTLIQTEVIDELALRAGIGEQVQAITARAMQGHLDFQQSFRQRMALLEGLSVDVLADIAAHLPIMPGAPRLFKALRALGYKTAILSGGFTYFAETVQALLGMDRVYANDLIAADGRLTGQVGDNIVDGARKAALLKALTEEWAVERHKTIAVGDGANDLAMLALAGLGVAFHAKPKVREGSQHAVQIGGLDALLYVMGLSDDVIDAL